MKTLLSLLSSKLLSRFWNRAARH